MPCRLQVVGGFSQGAALALAAALKLRPAEPFAGCVAFSGWRAAAVHPLVQLHGCGPPTP